MSSSSLIALADHLWQSTLFAVAVSCLTLLLRKNSARVRYLLWLAASAKFLVPFAVLTTVGAHIPWPRAQFPETESGLISSAGEQLAHLSRFGTQGAAAVLQVSHAARYAAVALGLFGSLWLLGTLIVATHWYARWRLVRRALRESTQTSLAFVTPVRTSSSQLEPAIVGIVRPVLLLPEGLEQRLSTAELRAVLAHERCHVTSKDNLAATLHMLVEALFWFHPLIWWLGARIIAERERACDEQVLADGHLPAIYAEGILKVCEHYLGSGLACVTGIGGANLRLRIEGILTNGLIEKLGIVRKLLITSAACMTIAVPVTMGLLTSSTAQAQAAMVDYSFDNESIAQIAEAVAKATHKNFLIDPRVAASGISVHFPRPLSPEEFYRIFLYILHTHHFIAVPAGDFIKILPDETVAHSADPTIYLGPLRPWELRNEVWLGFPDPAEWSPRH